MYLRADRIVVGAAFVALATASATVAIDNYMKGNVGTAVDERHAPESVVPSAVGLAAVQFGRDQYCLAEAMYHEARSEGIAGEKAVAEVILQRVRSSYYPNTVCEVVYEGTERGDQLCQFSYACDGSTEVAFEPKAWERSRQLASRIMVGAIRLGGQTNRAIAYHTVGVSPLWTNGMLRTGQIGNHIFYRRAQLVRASTLASKKPALITETLSQDGAKAHFDPTLIPISLLEIESEIEIDGALGNGS